MSKLSKSLTPILLSALTLMIIVLGFAPNQGVSNMDSLHLSDFNGTATPNFLVNQRGSGVIAEFQDGGTPIATWNDGGGFTTGGSGDFTISSNLVVGDEQILSAQTTFVVESNVPITPTGSYQPMTAAALGVSVSDVVTPTSATIGSLLLLHNIDSTDVITIDGTGKNPACKADIALAPADTLLMIWNGTNWNCISNYDNS